MGGIRCLHRPGPLPRGHFSRRKFSTACKKSSQKLAVELAHEIPPFHHGTMNQLQNAGGRRRSAFTLSGPPAGMRTWTPPEKGFALGHDGFTIIFDLLFEEDTARCHHPNASGKPSGAIASFQPGPQRRHRAPDVEFLHLQFTSFGMLALGLIDRLSIMILKVLPHEDRGHAAESAMDQHRRISPKKLAQLKEQLVDLKNCLQELLEQLQAGKRRFKISRDSKCITTPASIRSLMANVGGKHADFGADDFTIAPFSLGPDVAQFEKDFAKIIGRRTRRRVQFQRHPWRPLLGVARAMGSTPRPSRSSRLVRFPRNT